MPVIECVNDDDFPRQLAATSGKPTIVDFFASGCGPCRMIAPIFQQLSDQYANSVAFLKVDVDKCKDAAAANGVAAMPTFIVFLKGQKVDQFKGANVDELNRVVEKWGKVQGAGVAAEIVPGQIDLIGLIDKGQLECLNGCDDTPFRQFLEDSNANLKSKCDEQLILTVPFVQPVRLHSILVKGVGPNSPKTIRIFSNLPKTLDFDDAGVVQPTQLINTTDAVASDAGDLQALKFVKFQNVRSVQLFIENNVGGGDVTEISEMKFFGSPAGQATNMDNFKRVAGAKGESPDVSTAQPLNKRRTHTSHVTIAGRPTLRHQNAVDEASGSAIGRTDSGMEDSEASDAE